MATRKSKKAMATQETATDISANIVEFGTITDGDQLDKFFGDPNNVRNWEEYKLEVRPETVEVEGEEFPRTTYHVEIVSQDPKIQALWHSLFTFNPETQEATYQVTNPLVVVPNADGTYNAVSGSTRLHLAHSLRSHYAAGEYPHKINWNIPYGVRASMTPTERALSQVITNNGIPLTLWQQFEVMKLASAEGDDFSEVAKAAYPSKPGSLCYRLIQMRELELEGAPIKELSTLIGKFDTALRVLKEWEKLVKADRDRDEDKRLNVETVLPLSEIPAHIRTLTDTFTEKHVPLLLDYWKGLLLGETENGESESEEAEKEPKEAQPLSESWPAVVEAFNAIDAAIFQGDLDPAVAEQFAIDAQKLLKQFKRMQSVLFPQEKAPKVKKVKADKQPAADSTAEGEVESIVSPEGVTVYDSTGTVDPEDVAEDAGEVMGTSEASTDTANGPQDYGLELPALDY